MRLFRLIIRGIRLLNSRSKRMPEEIPDLRFNIDSTRTYALAELIDLAEAHNPATRVDWERARVQAGALGVTRSELFPTLASAAVSQTARQQAFFGRSLLRPGNPGLPG